MIDIAKRGTKFGIGLIIASQRPPKIDVDVRSQCNSLIAFRMTDAGSHYTVGRQDVLTKLEVRRISKLDIGQCLLTGKITVSPRVLTVRDINVRRAKKVDFEEILGIKGGPEHFEFKTTITEAENGDLIHKPSGTVIATIEKRVAEQDKVMVEQDEGDGVILRESHLSPEDQKLLRKLRKPDEKGDRLIG
ncbi:unnamed protein product [marine sediment metagenome]|uniref:ATP-binding protein n=1 Tax=marine sediment metagenome TaxID=412755 RepID=X0VZP3_9ZZZZ